MKYFLLLLSIPFLSASHCDHHKKGTTGDITDEADTSKIPACIKAMIPANSKAIPADAPMQIDQYRYKGKTVYAISAPCCDQFNTVMNDSCRVICAPSGGITGRGDGKCKDFADSAKLVKTIWKRPQK